MPVQVFLVVVVQLAYVWFRNTNVSVDKASLALSEQELAWQTLASAGMAESIPLRDG
jgi:hypothetical protein